MNDAADRIFGWIAVQKGLLTQARLVEAQTALAADRSGAFSLAEWLVMRGDLQPEQRDELARQLQAAASTATVAEPAPVRAHDDASRQTPMPVHPETVPSHSGVVPPIGLLGKYELLEEIGRGGMGVVYRAFDLELKRTVALKTLLLGDKLRPEAVERLLREARTAAVLNHPGIVPVHDVGTIDGVPFFAMAYLRGRNLDRLLRGNDLPGLRERAAVVSEVAHAIAHAHNRKVIHRDLKPSNILIDEAGRVHVMDFGLAKRLDEGERLTETGQMLGTPHYMPPEQIDGASDRVGAASDVYAIGAILYECLTGRPPFSGETLAEIVARALRCEPTPPSMIDRRIHVDLETICLKALDKDPLRRYPDAGAMSADLDRYLKGEAIEARPVGWRERWLRRLMRQKLLTAVAAIAVIAGAAAGIGAMESARLHSRVRRDLGEKSELYLDAALQLRRAGLPIARAAQVTLPRLQAIVAEADRLDPGRAEPHFHLGRFLRALMDFEAALAAQDTALVRNPGLAPARYERAVLTAYAHARRLHVLRERSAHLFDTRSSTGGLQRPPPVRNDAALEQEDTEARNLRARLLLDLNRLEADSAASGLSPARLACARGLALAYGPAPADDLRSAHALLESALAEDPSLEEAYEGLGRMAEASTDWVAAEAVYDRGVAADRGYVPFWIGRARVRLAAGADALRAGREPLASVAGAIADADQALSLEPNSFSARLLRSTAGWTWGRYKSSRGEDPAPMYVGAVADVGKAIAIDPTQPAAWAMRGVIRAAAGLGLAATGADPEVAWHDAVTDLSEALRLDPADGQNWAERGQVRTHWGLWQREHGRDPAVLFAGATDDLHAALDRDPGRGDSWVRTGIVHLAAAQEAADHGVPAEPGNRIRSAIDAFQQALRIDPENPEALARRAETHLLAAHQNGAASDAVRAELEAAILDATRALVGNPSLAEAYLARAAAGLHLARIGRTEGRDNQAALAAAHVDLDSALEHNPMLVRALLQRAESRRLDPNVPTGDDGTDPPGWAAALEDLSRAIDLRGDLADVWTARGRWRAERTQRRLAAGQVTGADLAEALQDLAKAESLNPRSATPVATRGRLLHALGRWAEARAALDAAMKINPNLGDELRPLLEDAVHHAEEGTPR